MSSAPQALALPHDFRALVIDDERHIRTTLTLCLETLGVHTRAVANSADALATLDARAADVCFLDLKLGTESGMALLPKLLAASPALCVVIITAYATFETAVDAIKQGAFHYLPKPFAPSQIRTVVEAAAERVRVRARVTNLESQLDTAVPALTFVSNAPAMRVALDVVARTAPTDASVLFRGESGTGKTVLARELHAWSRRSQRPFVVVNCPTLTEELLASELFGHARGAFTGALRDQPGRVEAAEGGTLFLDEIGEMPPALQAKLLRFLQEHSFERVGENKTRKADVRVLAATNRDLDDDVKHGRFREDLLYRLNVVEVTAPPLRERSADIVPLAEGFLTFFSRTGRNKVLSPEACAVLTSWRWPGNLRELRNLMERVSILWPGDVVLPEAFPARMQLQSATVELGGDHSLDVISDEHVRRVLARVATQEEAARILGVDPSTLWRMRKRKES